MHEKLLWFNPNIQFMFHGNIMEYDMVAMSVSISERFNLLDPETIKILKLLPKEKRTVKVGLIQKENKEFSKRLISCELEIRRKFLETNGLDESNVLSLHSDAVIFNSHKEIVNVIDGIEFKHVDTWSSYMNYNGTEMFYDNGVITYKGIPKDMLNRHALGIHKYLCNVFKKIDNYDTEILKYLSRFQTLYLKDKLQDFYYLPFGTNGEYKMHNLSLFAFVVRAVLNDMKGW